MNENQMRMILRSRDAYDLNGRRTRDVDVVQTPAGTATHLAFSGSADSQTLCGNPVIGPSPAWFQLSGCKKCARSAAKRNIGRITDTDGTLLELPDITTIDNDKPVENPSELH